jgi:hypothetical protein
LNSWIWCIKTSKEKGRRHTLRDHIGKRAKDSYSIKVSVGKDATGKYKFQWTTVKGPKKEAQKRLSEILHQLDTGMSSIRPWRSQPMSSASTDWSLCWPPAWNGSWLRMKEKIQESARIITLSY